MVSKKLSTVVLDLDNTLIYTASDGQLLSCGNGVSSTNIGSSNIASGNSKGVSSNSNTAISNNNKPYDYSFFINEPHYSNYFGYFRPYMVDFLRLLPDYFDQIIVWSAGTTDYVNYICYFVFSTVGYVPNIILARDSCVKLANGKFSKPLNRIFSDFHADPNRTFLIDDSKFSMEPNYSSNCMLVEQPYNGELDDCYLRDVLIPWLRATVAG